MQSFFLGNDPANANNPVQQIRFSGGATWNLATIVSQVGIAATHPVYGTIGNDTLSGAGSNFTLYGGKGNDVYVVDGAGDVVVDCRTKAPTGSTRVSASRWTARSRISRSPARATRAAPATPSSTRWSATAARTASTGAAAQTWRAAVSATTPTWSTTRRTAWSKWPVPVSRSCLSLGQRCPRQQRREPDPDRHRPSTARATRSHNCSSATRATNRSTAARADTMTGGAGNDVYVVDVLGDSTVEVALGGTDTVESNIAWTLGAEVENLLLTGSAGSPAPAMRSPTRSPATAATTSSMAWAARHPGRRRGQRRLLRRRHAD